MDFLGIGPLELIFILIIALIVLGPKDMVKAGKSIGRLLRKLVMSPNWRAIQQTSREIRTLPNRLMREAGLDELQSQLPQMDEIRRESGVDDLASLEKDVSDWTTPPTIGKPAPEATQGSSASPSPSSEVPAQED